MATRVEAIASRRRPFVTSKIHVLMTHGTVPRAVRSVPHAFQAMYILAGTNDVAQTYIYI